jgi:hypothetical protein
VIRGAEVRDKVLFAAMIVGMTILAACSPLLRAQEEPQLTFEIAMQVSSAQEFHASLGVRNDGQRVFKGDNSFNGQMEVRRMPSGELRASAHVVPLRPLEPGDTAWPTSWRGQLEAGIYELTWGAEGYGSTREEFSVAERNGRLYFRSEQLAAVRPDTEPEPPSVEEQVALVDEAVFDLMRHLDVGANEINVRGIEPTEFQDASLGVPEPGETYAQVITPGFVIRLEVKGQLYTYHAAADRVVRVLGEEEAEPSSQVEPACREVTVSDLGLTFEVPADWMQLEPNLAWTPELRGELGLGLAWTELEPPMEPEAVLLPSPSQIVNSDPVDLVWARGRRFTLEVYAPAAAGGDTKAPVESVETHVLLTVDRGEERLGLDFYASAPSAAGLEQLEPALQHILESALWAEERESSPPVTDESLKAEWQVFTDENYGFQVSIPQDWTFKEMETEGPGVPEDWPLERNVILFPEAWAERFEKTGGPPDPNAPPAAPPVILEVYVGTKEQFRRAYPEPTVEEELEINGLKAVHELEVVSDEVQLMRYVFQDLDDETVRVVLTDNYAGFVERREGNPEITDLIQVVIGTFAFDG